MNNKSESDRLLIRYLLGDLPEAESQQIEDRYFAEPEFLKQLEIVEDELIDGYVKGELSEHEHSQFEQYFANSPERREKIAFAKTRIQAISEEPTPVIPEVKKTPTLQNFLSLMKFSPSLRLGATVAIILIVALGVFQVIDKQPDIRSFRLSPGQVRETQDVATLIIPLSDREVELQLSVEKPLQYQSYKVSLETDEGAQVWSQANLKLRSTDAGQVIFVTIPSKILAHNQNHLAKLEGQIPGRPDFELLDLYPFHVERL